MALVMTQIKEFTVCELWVPLFPSRFSYNAVHFALCHIYSGTSNIPDTINIVELATLADMLGLEGLKEVIMYTLKVKYCHFFHKVSTGNWFMKSWLCLKAVICFIECVCVVPAMHDVCCRGVGMPSTCCSLWSWWHIPEEPTLDYQVLCEDLAN
jgi:hypothetical protein